MQPRWSHVPPAASTSAPGAAPAATAAPQAVSVEDRLRKIGWLPGSPDHPKGWKTTLPNVTAAPPPQLMTVWANKRVELGDKFSNDSKDSPMVQISKELFGLDFKLKFSGGGDDWSTKWNLALASGDCAEPAARIRGEGEVIAAADRLVANTAEEARHELLQ